MPKIATKFTADVTIKVGRQSMSVNMPVNLADVEDVEDVEEDDVVGAVIKLAKDRLDESLKVGIGNANELKKAYKAYREAYP